MTEVDKPAPMGERQEMLGMFRLMLLIRRFEEAASEAYTRGKIGGFLHLNIGEEATIAGSVPYLGPEDYIFSNYREHGHALARGLEPKLIMAELFGKSTGVSGGRGGSMHLFDAQRHFMGGYAIVGGALPIAAGAALALQYRGSAGLVMSIFGEGSTNIGAFHEAFNLASLWKLPVFFYCINNQYAMGSALRKDSALTDIYAKACAYGMLSDSVDGMDVLAVREAARMLLAEVREQRKPVFLEALTYRFRGHSMADPLRYRTREELRQWMQRDPIELFRQRLTGEGVASPSELDDLGREAKQSVAEALDFAERSPEPPPEDLYRNVYVEEGVV